MGGGSHFNFDCGHVEVVLHRRGTMVRDSRDQRDHIGHVPRDGHAGNRDGGWNCVDVASAFLLVRQPRQACKAAAVDDRCVRP